MSKDISRRKMLSPAWLWGGTGLHATASAGAVRCRSTGGRSSSRGTCRRTRSGHRNTREEPADIATRHSPSATERAPWSPCCTRCNTSSSSDAIAIRAGAHQTKRTREAYAFLVLECSRNKRSTVSASRVPTIRLGGWDSRGAIER
jgi:hypothetical protein